MFLPIFLFFFFNLHAQDSLKTFKATRIISPPKIDGMLDDEAWKNSEVISDFVQNTPNLKTDLSSNLQLFALMKSYNAFFGGGGISPVSNYDYYEPRVTGRYFRTTQYYLKM